MRSARYSKRVTSTPYLTTMPAVNQTVRHGGRRSAGGETATPQTNHHPASQNAKNRSCAKSQGAQTGRLARFRAHNRRSSATAARTAP